MYNFYMSLYIFLRVKYLFYIQVQKVDLVCLELMGQLVNGFLRLHKFKLFIH